MLVLYFSAVNVDDPKQIEVPGQLVSPAWVSAGNKKTGFLPVFEIWFGV